MISLAEKGVKYLFLLSLVSAPKLPEEKKLNYSMKVPEMMKSALKAAATDPMFSMDL